MFVCLCMNYCLCIKASILPQKQFLNVNVLSCQSSRPFSERCSSVKVSRLGYGPIKGLTAPIEVII